MEENASSAYEQLTIGEKTECDETGLLLTLLFPGSSYDKDTFLWDFSGSPEMMGAVQADDQ